MEIRKIDVIRMECSDCGTSVIIPVDSISTEPENQKSFVCPNCGKEKEKLISAAQKCAVEYNKACDKAKLLHPEYCIFGETGEF